MCQLLAEARLRKPHCNHVLSGEFVFAVKEVLVKRLLGA
jgi:hypothetical protein